MSKIKSVAQDRDQINQLHACMFLYLCICNYIGIHRHIVSGVCAIPFELRSDCTHYRPICQCYKYQCTGFQIPPSLPSNLKLAPLHSNYPLLAPKCARIPLAKCYKGQETLTFKDVNGVLLAPTNANPLPLIPLDHHLVTQFFTAYVITPVCSSTLSEYFSLS